MSEVHHFAYAVDKAECTGQDSQFWQALGFTPTSVRGEFEQQIRQVWLRNDDGVEVHVVYNPDSNFSTAWGWGHVCVVAPSDEVWEAGKQSEFLERANPLSERYWLRSPGGCRVEVRKPSESRRTVFQEAGAVLEGSPRAVAQVLEEALDIYLKRHPHYGDQWKKYGWRGAIYNARRKVERMWAQLWNAEPSDAVAEATKQVSGVDDGLDTIVYLAMAIVAVREGNRDGMGAWWD